MTPERLAAIKARADDCDYDYIDLRQDIDDLLAEVETLTEKGQGLCIQNGQLLIELHDVKRRRDEAIGALVAEVERLRAESDEIARLHAAGVRIQASQAKRIAELERVAKAAARFMRNDLGYGDFLGAGDALSAALRAAGFLEEGNADG